MKSTRTKNQSRHLSATSTREHGGCGEGVRGSAKRADPDERLSGVARMGCDPYTVSDHGQPSDQCPRSVNSTAPYTVSFNLRPESLLLNGSGKVLVFGDVSWSYISSTGSRKYFLYSGRLQRRQSQLVWSRAAKVVVWTTEPGVTKTSPDLKPLLGLTDSKVVTFTDSPVYSAINGYVP